MGVSASADARNASYSCSIFGAFYSYFWLCLLFFFSFHPPFSSSRYIELILYIDTYASWIADAKSPSRVVKMLNIYLPGLRNLTDERGATRHGRASFPQLFVHITVSNFSAFLLPGKVTLILSTIPRAYSLEHKCGNFLKEILPSKILIEDLFDRDLEKF